MSEPVSGLTSRAPTIPGADPQTRKPEIKLRPALAIVMRTSSARRTATRMRRTRAISRRMHCLTPTSACSRPSAFGHIATTDGLEAPAFQALLKLARSEHCWFKLIGPYRVSKQPPLFAGVTPCARALVAAAPERCVWGTDWPLQKCMTMLIPHPRPPSTSSGQASPEWRRGAGAWNRDRRNVEQGPACGMRPWSRSRRVMFSIRSMRIFGVRSQRVPLPPYDAPVYGDVTAQAHIRTRVVAAPHPAAGAAATRLPQARLREQPHERPD